MSDIVIIVSHIYRYLLLCVVAEFCFEFNECYLDFVKLLQCQHELQIELINRKT